MHLDNDFIKLALPQAEIIQGSLHEQNRFSVDSRTLQVGDIFIALKGNSVDGHAFIQQALTKGAAGLIIEKEQRNILKLLPSHLLKNKFILAVNDTWKSVIDLASSWRKQWTLPVIGITGSVGKTSTKELIGQILFLSGKKVFVAEGNQNTLIGISLNILRLNSSYDIAIFELGITKRGEMVCLADLVNPTYAIITSIGHAHMAGLGSIVDIASEKRQIFKNFKEQNIGVIHGDQQLLAMTSYNHPVLKFGFKTTNQIQARKIQVHENSIDFILKIYSKKYSIHISTINEGQVSNILAATAVSVLVGIPDAIIVQAVQQPIFIKGRFNIKPIKNNLGSVVDDCYNANPESMKSALVAFERIEHAGSKIAVLGDMNELGIESLFWHRQLGRFLRKAPSICHLILIGTQIKNTSKTLPVNMKFDLVETWQEGLELLNKLLHQEKKSLVLVKGSTGGYRNGLVNIIQQLTIQDTSAQELNLIAAIKDNSLVEQPHG